MCVIFARVIILRQMAHGGEPREGRDLCSLICFLFECIIFPLVAQIIHKSFPAEKKVLKPRGQSVNALGRRSRFLSKIERCCLPFTGSTEVPNTRNIQLGSRLKNASCKVKSFKELQRTVCIACEVISVFKCRLQTVFFLFRRTKASVVTRL